MTDIYKLEEEGTSEIIKYYINEFNLILNFENLSWWIIDLDTNPNLYYCNETMSKVFSLDPKSKKYSVKDTCPIAGDYIKNVELISSKKAKQILFEFNQLLEGKLDQYHNVFPYQCPIQKKKYYFSSRAKIFNSKIFNNQRILYGIIENITEAETARLQQLEQSKSYQKLSEFDYLTKIYNRRKFMDVFIREFNHSLRRRTAISLLMIDVDYFKAYNDNYGHLQGDECLKTIATLIDRCLTRETDVVARYGGEEFIVLLTDIDYVGMEKIATKILESVSGSNIQHNTSKVSGYVTISIGGLITVNKRVENKYLDLIQQADELLYEAKAQGRNRVVLTCLS